MKHKLIGIIAVMILLSGCSTQNEKTYAIKNIYTYSTATSSSQSILNSENTNLSSEINSSLKETSEQFVSSETTDNSASKTDQSTEPNENTNNVNSEITSDNTSSSVSTTTEINIPTSDEQSSIDTSISQPTSTSNMSSSDTLDSTNIANKPDETNNSSSHEPPFNETTELNNHIFEKPNIDVYLDYKFEYEILDNGTLRLTSCPTRYRAPDLKLDSKVGLVLPSELDGRTVTEIGDEFLTNCSFFSCLEIPDSVTKIGEGAFSGCDNMEYVKLPDSLTDLGEFAFNGCSKLKSIKIPTGVNRINDFCFAECKWLVRAILPENITYIGECAFSHCSLYEPNINIPNSVIYIGSAAFDRPNALIWEEEVGYMGKWVVGCNRSLTVNDIEIKNGIEKIANSAFYNSPYASITIPKSVTYIGDYAFYGCGWLKNIYYKGTETEWKNINISQEGNESLLSAKIHFVS